MGMYACHLPASGPQQGSSAQKQVRVLHAPDEHQTGHCHDRKGQGQASLLRGYACQGIITAKHMQMAALLYCGRSCMRPRGPDKRASIAFWRSAAESSQPLTIQRHERPSSSGKAEWRQKYLLMLQQPLQQYQHDLRTAAGPVGCCDLSCCCKVQHMLQQALWHYRHDLLTASSCASCYGFKGCWKFLLKLQQLLQQCKGWHPSCCCSPTRFGISHPMLQGSDVNLNRIPGLQL